MPYTLAALDGGIEQIAGAGHRVDDGLAVLAHAESDQEPRQGEAREKLPEFLAPHGGQT
jgi:hypothetical protein